MRLAQSWNAAELRDRYARDCGIDIAQFLRAPDIELWEDEELGVQYFRGCEPGDDLFYEQLSKAPWYYALEKWEHQHVRAVIRQGFQRPVVLDVGCGSGEFLELMRNAGVPTVEGIEFNKSAVEACRRKGFEVSSRNLSELGESAKRYDVICAFQVLEHVTDPLQLLADMKKILKPGGLMLISTPNRESFTANFRWDLLDMPPHHLTRWNARAFARVAEKVGLSLKTVEIEPLADYHAAWYLKSRFAKLPESLQKVLSYPLNRMKMPAPVRRKIVGHTILGHFGHK